MIAPESHSEAASYQEAGFSRRLGWVSQVAHEMAGKRPALLLIDVCKAYFTPGSPLDLGSNPAAAASPDTMRCLLRAARKAKIPVVHTQVRYTNKDMSDAGLFYKKARVLDVWLQGDERGYDEPLPGLEPVEGEHMILKKHASAFFGTD
ncbi:Putative isochorismatase [Septoria linicola]|uniref:Isochorismatase n=1 Tax=Septoria linicola TaxID=215465 RepID=A0A9Q9AGP4_9PEZI|nr:Putative isochorismatase [Septoria linicola]